MPTQLDTPCVISSWCKNKAGYGHSSNGKRGPNVLHHRVVYCEHNKITLAAIKGVMVRHKCDNPPCINPAHLLLGSAQDNVDDMVSRNRIPRGDKRPNAKLDEEKVRQIKLRSRESNADLAAEFGVDPTLISRIQSGKRWSHVK